MEHQCPRTRDGVLSSCIACKRRVAIASHHLCHAAWVRRAGLGMRWVSCGVASGSAFYSWPASRVSFPFAFPFPSPLAFLHLHNNRTPIRDTPSSYSTKQHRTFFFQQVMDQLPPTPGSSPSGSPAASVPDTSLADRPAPIPHTRLNTTQVPILPPEEFAEIMKETTLHPEWSEDEKNKHIKRNVAERLSLRHDAADEVLGTLLGCEQWMVVDDAQVRLCRKFSAGTALLNNLIVALAPFFAEAKNREKREKSSKHSMHRGQPAKVAKRRAGATSGLGPTIETGLRSKHYRKPAPGRARNKR